MPKVITAKWTRAEFSPPALPVANDSSSRPVEWEWQGASEFPSNLNHGLLKLSAELVDEVLSYLGCTSDQTNVRRLIPFICLELPRTLRALSQTCAAYRKVFLPMQWHTFDACSYGVCGLWHTATMLKGQCMGLKNHPELAQYVRTVRVVITRNRPAENLSQLVSCLQSLPNVHTLHILHTHTQMTTILREYFQGKTLPTIRRVILPDYAHEILRSCPNVTFVRCITNNPSKLITAMQENCRKVEVLEGICLSIRLAKRIVKAAPKLKSIRLRPWTPISEKGSIEELGERASIHRIELELPIPGNYSVSNLPPTVQDIVPEAKRALRASLSTERKMIKIWYRKEGDGQMAQRCINIGLDE